MEVVTEKPKKKNVSVGYKRTEIGVIPDDWIVKEFGNITKPSNLRISATNTDRNIKCIELEHIQQGTGQVDGYSNLQDQKSTKTIFSKGDVLFGKLRPYLRKFHYAEFDGACSTEIWVFPKGDGVDNKYLYYIVQLDSFIEASNKSTGTHMPRADWDVVKEHKVAFPPALQEQQAIAEALSDVDALIAELDVLIEKKQQVKKGAMQQLLTGNKRLPGFDGEWEEKKLGEVLYVQGGYAFKSANFQKFGIPIIRISNIQDGAIDLEESAFYSPDSHIPNEFKIEKGEALIAMSGATTGKVGLYSHDQVAYQNQRVGKFVVNDSRHTDDSYILHLVSSDHFRKVLSKELEQGAQPNVSAKQLEGLVFNMPNDVEEQKAIAQILGDIDAEIQGLQSKRVKYEQIKQGMMQELLTGKTRLVE